MLVITDGGGGGGGGGTKPPLQYLDFTSHIDFLYGCRYTIHATNLMTVEQIPEKKHARDKYIVTPTKLNAALAAIPTIALYIKFINIFPYK